MLVLEQVFGSNFLFGLAQGIGAFEENNRVLFHIAGDVR